MSWNGSRRCKLQRFYYCLLRSNWNWFRFQFNYFPITLLYNDHIVCCFILTPSSFSCTIHNHFLVRQPPERLIDSRETGRKGKAFPQTSLTRIGTRFRTAIVIRTSRIGQFPSQDHSHSTPPPPPLTCRPSVCKIELHAR